jgi:copper(I)-binding protein
VKSGAVTWTAGKDAALPADQKGEFVLAGTLPRTPGPLWFKVQQRCGDARLDWAQVPAQGTSTDGLKTPAVLLQVLSARDLALFKMLPAVEGAWVRSSVAGQQGTGAFMKLTAKEPMQLVGASTPVAGTADVHEMKMEGEVMRMRAVPALDLPAGQTVELKPGGYHLMLQDLKQPLQPGSVVPVTLLFRSAKGEETKLELKLPVAAQAPGTIPGSAAAEHMHKH